MRYLQPIIFILWMGIGLSFKVHAVSESSLQTTTVKKGENLLDVAQRCQTSTDELIQINNLQKPYKIYIGQPLRYKKNLPKSAQKAPVEVPAEGDDEFPQTFDDGPILEPIKKNKNPESETIKNTNFNFAWPAKGKILSSFGKKKMGHKNDGLNIAVKFQAPVLASEDGIVVYAGNEIRGFGNMILIKHGKDWSTAYAHNEVLLVSKGETVKRGQTIAKAGNTGHVDVPQIHFELRHKSKPVDPMKHLKKD